MKKTDVESIVDTLFSKILGNGNLELFDDVFHEKYNRGTDDLTQGSAKYLVNPNYRNPGKEGFREWIKTFIQKSQIDGLFNWRFEINDIIFEDTRAAVFYRLHWDIFKLPKEKDLFPIPVHNTVSCSVDGVHKIKFQDNKIIAMELVADTLTMALDLGGAVLDVTEIEKLQTYIKKLKNSGMLPF